MRKHPLMYKAIDFESFDGEGAAAAIALLRTKATKHQKHLFAFIKICKYF